MTVDARAERRTASAIGLGLVATLLLLRANQFGEWFLRLTPLASRDLFWWSMSAATLGYVHFVERRPFGSIGIRRPDRLTLPLAVLFALFAHYPLNWIGGEIVDTFHLSNATGQGAALAIDTKPYWYRALLVTRAAIAEEIVFRGYMIERMEELTGSRVLACVLSVALFTYAHLAYWGLAPLVFVALVGLLAAVVYQWRRDLGLNIIAHWLIDAAVSLTF